MYFIDASFYLSLLNSSDSNHKKAVLVAKKCKNNTFITSYMVIGEVLTVGCQRFNKKATIEFVQKIFSSNTRIMLEKPKLIIKAFELLKKIKTKNISWVDCYSLITIKEHNIPNLLSFDKHLLTRFKQ